jgi:hypothetical protein
MIYSGDKLNAGDVIPMGSLILHIDSKILILILEDLEVTYNKNFNENSVLIRNLGKHLHNCRYRRFDNSDYLSYTYEFEVVSPD